MVIFKHSCLISIYITIATEKQTVDSKSTVSVYPRTDIKYTISYHLHFHPRDRLKSAPMELYNGGAPIELYNGGNQYFIFKT